MITIDEKIKYWVDSAERDQTTMKALFSSKRYPESLFFGHLVLEKMLKAFVIRETKNEPPKIHDLSYLAKLANLGLEKDILDYFELVNKFNTRARYDNYKKAFYKTCAKEYAEEHAGKITAIYKNLCQKIKQKK